MKALFEIGQQIVCVNAVSLYGSILPLKEGKTYKVKGFYTCACGLIGLDVGIGSNKSSLICVKCYHREDNSRIWYFRQDRFVPVDHVNNVNELIEESTYETIRA